MQYLIEEGKRQNSVNSETSRDSLRGLKQKLNFVKLVKKGKVNMKHEQKYVATPIVEQSEDYNTYDS